MIVHLKSLLVMLKSWDQVFSLDLFNNVEVQDDPMILEKIALRNEAKKNKDFALADQIRDELLQNGIRLIDTRDGTTYEKC